jgi:hypothetical protein
MEKEEKKANERERKRKKERVDTTYHFSREM